VTHNAAFLIRTKASFVTPSTAKSLPSGSSKWLVMASAIPMKRMRERGGRSAFSNRQIAEFLYCFWFLGGALILSLCRRHSPRKHHHGLAAFTGKRRPHYALAVGIEFRRVRHRFAAGRTQQPSKLVKHRVPSWKIKSLGAADGSTSRSLGGGFCCDARPWPAILNP